MKNAGVRDFARGELMGARVPPQQARGLSRRTGAGAAASGVALAAGLGMPQRAAAREWNTAGDIGAFIAFHFGAAEGGMFGLGIEGHGVYMDMHPSCEGAQQLYAGAVARMEAVGWHEMRLTLGPVAGRSNGMYGYAGEATAGVALGGGVHPSRLIAELGAELNAVLLFNARAAYAIGGDAHLGLGVRWPPLSTSSFCVVGRRLRRDQGTAAATAGALLAAPAPGRDRDEERARAAAVWLRRARLEWASVPAFCELAEQLEVSGAPEAFVQRARSAACDEVRHAALSAQVAAQLADAVYLSLDPPAADRRVAASGSEGLARLARESWTDGCLGESTAAAVALCEAEQATSGSTQRFQASLAADEARHGDLAWDILEWTISRDGAADIAPLLVAMASRPDEPIEDSDGGLSSLRSFGVLDHRQVTAVRGETVARARQRLAPRLA